jgi:glycosyltransferase involved in cell wall biosynthesis
MRLLVLSHFYPLPANNGTKMRTWALLRALAAEGHDVTLLTFADPHEADGREAELRQVCNQVECLPWTLPSLSSSRKHAARLKAILSPLPYGVLRFQSEAMKQAVLGLLRGHSFDAIFCMAPYVLINLPAALPVPLILNNHNLEYIILHRYLIHDANPARRLYARLEARKMKAWEQRAWSAANLVTACSEHDKHLMNQLCPNLFVAVLPNVIDVDTYAPSLGDDGQTVLYAGGMDWYPNRDAVKFFVSDIMPELRKSAPGVRFVVAGRSDSDDFPAKFTTISDVHFTGTVPDMRPEMAKAAVSVVPLRIGSGTRLKILEAAAMAKPIVSTRVGAEGLDFVDGEEIILADDPKLFARAVADLLADSSRRARLGQAARRRVEQQYGFPALRTALRAALEKLAGHPPEPGSGAVAAISHRQVAA